MCHGRLITVVDFGIKDENRIRQKYLIFFTSDFQ